MALNDLEQRNGRYFALFYRIRYIEDQLPCYVPVVEVRPIIHDKKCTPKNLVYGNIWLLAIFLQITEDERVKKSHPHSTAKIRLVQHCAAISAITELCALLLFTHSKLFVFLRCVWLVLVTALREEWTKERKNI